jgi:hypothetical protein
VIAIGEAFQVKELGRFSKGEATPTERYQDNQSMQRIDSNPLCEGEHHLRSLTTIVSLLCATLFQ